MDYVIHLMVKESQVSGGQAKSLTPLPNYSHGDLQQSPSEELEYMQVR